MPKRTVAGEQYFTSLRLARKCVEFVDARCGLAAFDLIVEPSAGDGVFYELLPDSHRVGIDILPKHPEIIPADFLTWVPGGFDRLNHPGRILTIGNPPFGQRGALAVAFIEHAATFSHTIAFILPRSFNKYTFQNRVPREFQLLAGFGCDEFVDPNGNPKSVKAVFQIWQRQDELRELTEPPQSHPDFEMRHAHLSRLTGQQLAQLRQEFEFTIPQVGADFRPRDVENVTKGSHWFIKPNAPGVRERFERLDFSFLDGMNTAHKSLSKRDIVQAYVATMDSALRLAPPAE